jgi:hypothetical protein
VDPIDVPPPLEHIAIEQTGVVRGEERGAREDGEGKRERERERVSWPDLICVFISVWEEK